MNILPTGIRSSFHMLIPANQGLHSATHEVDTVAESEEKNTLNRFRLDDVKTLAAGALGGFAAYKLLPVRTAQPVVNTPWMLWVTAIGGSAVAVGNTIWHAFDRKTVVNPMLEQFKALQEEMLEKDERISDLGNTVKNFQYKNDFWTVETANLKDKFDDLVGIVRRLLPAARAADRASIQTDMAQAFPVAVKKASKKGTSVSFVLP